MVPDPELARQFELTQLPANFAEDPFPVYRSLLCHAPVKRFHDGSVMLSRWGDLDRIYRNTRSFSSDKKKEFLPKYGPSPLYEHHTTSLVFNDPPLHTRVRKIIVGAMTPRAIAALEAGLVEVVDDLLDSMAQKHAVDLVTDYASCIPIEVIGNLFAIPHDRRGPLRDWSLAILGALEPVLDDRRKRDGNEAVDGFKEFLGELVSERRRKPGDPATDVLTRLLRGLDGQGLGELELLHNCIFILNAGHETTTNLIANALELLALNESEKKCLAQRPDHIATAIDEFLRFQSPNQLGNRITTCPVEFHGQRLETGTSIHLCIGAANRDPRQFHQPDRLDITRKPNRHLAFAGGPHLCAGFSLARMEGRIAIERFQARFPDYRLLDGARRTGRIRFRGFETLPATLA